MNGCQREVVRMKDCQGEYVGVNGCQREANRMKGCQDESVWCEWLSKGGWQHERLLR